MLSATVSAIALVMAIGPHLHVSLQAAVDEARPAAETVSEEVVVEESLPEAAESIATETTETVLIADPETTETVRNADPETTETVLIAQPETAETTIEASEPDPVRSNQVAEADWPAILDQVSAALSAVRTARGNFVQSNADGSITTGTFALNRPGRMRFDYDDPTPILIVSNGTTVAMEDSELETIDRVPIGSTPLGLILSTDLRFDEDVDVLSVLRNEDRIGVRVSDATGELEGTLTLVLDAASYDLLGWLATDGNLQTTVVDLLDIEKNVRLDPRLFRLDDAEDEEDER
jgi:outer membrane lipoprotein-sorting protein